MSATAAPSAIRRPQTGAASFLSTFSPTAAATAVTSIGSQSTLARGVDVAGVSTASSSVPFASPRRHNRSDSLGAECTNSVFYARGYCIPLPATGRTYQTTSGSIRVEDTGVTCVTNAATGNSTIRGWFGVTTHQAEQEFKIDLIDLIGAQAGENELEVIIAWAPVDMKGVSKRHEQDTIKRSLRTWKCTLTSSNDAAALIADLQCASTHTPGLSDAIRKHRLKRILVLVNPHGGRHDSLQIFQRIVEPMLKYSGFTYELVVTKYAGHAKRVGAQFRTHSADQLRRGESVADLQDVHDSASTAAYEGAIIIGGDGTVHEFVTGMATRPNWHESIRRVCICSITGGSTNAIASGIRTRDATYAMWCVIKQRIRPLDAMLVVNGHDVRTLAVCVFGWGIATGVAADAEPYRHLGVYRYSYLKMRHALMMGKGYERYQCTLDISTDVALTDKELYRYFSAPISTSNSAEDGGILLAPDMRVINHFTRAAPPCDQDTAKDVSSSTVLGMSPEQCQDGLVNIHEATADVLQRYQQQRVRLEEGPQTFILRTNAQGTGLLPAVTSVADVYAASHKQRRQRRISQDAAQASVEETPQTTSIAAPLSDVSSTAAHAFTELHASSTSTSSAEVGVPLRQALDEDILLPTAVDSVQRESTHVDGGFGALTMCGPGCATCRAHGCLRYIGDANVTTVSTAAASTSSAVPRFSSSQAAHARVLSPQEDIFTTNAANANPETSPETSAEDESQQQVAHDVNVEHDAARRRWYARLFHRTRRARSGSALGTTIKNPRLPASLEDEDAAPRPGVTTKADLGCSDTHTVATGVTKRGFFKRREVGNFTTIVAISLASEALYHHASDGYFDLLLIRRGAFIASARLALRYLGQVLGLTDIYGPPLVPHERPKHIASALVDYVKARSMIITPAPDQLNEGACVDGELFPGPGPFKVYLLPSFLTMYGEM